MRFSGFSSFRQEEINARPRLSVPSSPLCSRFCAPHGDRKPTASVACSDEAVQGSAKAGANRMELLELENVIGDHPRAGLVRGSRSRASSPQSHGSKEKGSPRVGEVRAACRRAGKSVVTLSRSSLLTLSRSRTCSKCRGDRSGLPPHPRFRSVHWRLVAGAANAFGRAYPAGSASHEEELASERRR